MLKVAKLLIVVFILTGCSDATPIKFTKQQKVYLGIWLLHFEDITENTVRIDNMLLSIKPDGRAMFLECESSEKSSGNSKSSSSSSSKFPDAVVTQITDKTITIVQEVAGFGFSKDLDIDKSPYLENDNWYLNIEGKKLLKVTDSSSYRKANWDCGKKDD